MERERTRLLVLYSLFLAMIILMAFTPLGYLKTAGLEITFITIPVVIGAVALGAKGGALLGLAFGVTSFIQCFGMSPFGAALFAINPLGCAVTCIVPRVLMGFLTGLVFKGVNRLKPNSFLSFGAASLFGPICNTVLFMTSLMLFFGNADMIAELRGGMALIPFIAAFVGVNGLVEAAVCFVVCTAVCKALSRYLMKRPIEDGNVEKTSLPGSDDNTPEKTPEEK